MNSRTLMVTLLVAGVARAGNQDSYLLSNDAALSAGAVIAYGQDAGSLWYNPAGLAMLERAALDLSASAFVLRLRNFERSVTTQLPSETIERDLSTTELLSVPTSLVFAREVTDGLTLALGVFVPLQDSFAADDYVKVNDVVPDSGVAVDYEQRVAMTWDVARYDLVLGGGWEPVDIFRVGLSASLIYERATATTQLWGHVLDPNQESPLFDASEFYEPFVEAKRIAMQFTLGMQLEMAPRWHLGVVVRSPPMQLHRWGRVTELVARSSVGVGAPVSAAGFFSQDLPGGFELYGPTRVYLGVTRVFDWGWIALEADYAHAFESEDLAFRTEHVGNARVGARFEMSPAWIGGVGLFTDMSAEPRPEALGGASLDYVGLTGGVEYRKRYELAAEEGDTEPRHLEFSTTFALRYAVGFGETGGLLVDLTDDATELIVGATHDAVFHEVSLHIGSSVSF